MQPIVIVLDSNTLLSTLIRPYSVPYQAFEKAFAEGIVVYSPETLAEIERVIVRPKFNKYFTDDDRSLFIAKFVKLATLIPEIPFSIAACRDPKDDKFLTLAVAANADYIVTGDDDLLVLHPFRGIQIIKPAEFLTLEI